MNVKINDNSAAVKEQLNRNIEKALTEIGLKWQEIVTKEITDMKAVDTGRLRSSMTYEVDAPNKRTVVGTNVEYAPYVHEGTSRMAARPFLKNSLLSYKDDYQEIVSKTLGEGFEVSTKI